MSQENVETVRRIYEAALRRDAATVLALYDPGVELDASRIGVSMHPSGGDATTDTMGSGTSSATGTRRGGRSSTTMRS